MRVETVRGARAVDGLGTTLMHEHVFVLTPDVMQNYGHEWWWDEQDRGADAEATAGAQGHRRRRGPDHGDVGP
jgi:predicted metal-dependent phosphotriesterase family hydrolase